MIVSAERAARVGCVSPSITLETSFIFVPVRRAHVRLYSIWVHPVRMLQPVIGLKVITQPVIAEVKVQHAECVPRFADRISIRNQRSALSVGRVPMSRRGAAAQWGNASLTNPIRRLPNLALKM